MIRYVETGLPNAVWYETELKKQKKPEKERKIIKVNDLILIFPEGNVSSDWQDQQGVLNSRSLFNQLQSQIHVWVLSNSHPALWCQVMLSWFKLDSLMISWPYLSSPNRQTHGPSQLFFSLSLRVFTSVFVCCLLPHKDHRVRSEAAAREW